MHGDVIRNMARTIGGPNLINFLIGRWREGEVYRELEARRWDMIRDAEVARDLLAYSWRASDDSPVYIGAVALGRNANGEYKTFWGGNFTIRPTPRPMPQGYVKPCAEREAVYLCLSEGYYPVALVIFTDYNQTDDVTNRIEELLMPCHTCCTDVMGTLPIHTTVISARRRRQGDSPDLGGHPEFVYMERTLYWLRAFHKLPQF